MSHTSRLYPGLHAVIKTMPRMWIQLFVCVCSLFYGVTWILWPYMGIVTSHKSHGRNARFWLVERNFAALWLVRTYSSLYDYWQLLSFKASAKYFNPLSVNSLPARLKLLSLQLLCFKDSAKLLTPSSVTLFCQRFKLFSLQLLSFKALAKYFTPLSVTLFCQRIKLFSLQSF